MSSVTRRTFLRHSASGLAAGSLAAHAAPLVAGQLKGDRPAQAADVRVVNPRMRVPVGLIIDDSTCLVNLNRFAIPQFDAAWEGTNAAYHRNWREWPEEIPDAFVRKFGEWCAEHGVKGKYSIVPYPACVGRLDRGLPGWTQRELSDSLDLVRTLMTPNWDIHPEMVTHTRVIDLATGHPYADHSKRFMENWDWTTGRSADELAAYIAYSLRILKNVGLPCEGMTTPGSFGAKVLPELAIATRQAVSDVFGAEIPHYFRHAFTKGTESVAPRVEYASGLDSATPQCVVSVIACTSDWTGGWDNTPVGGVDNFITEDLKSGRMVEVIDRGEPAIILSHWTGIHWNGQELGFTVFKEVVRRLHARYDHLLWMKLAELSRYWAAKELTRIERAGGVVAFRAPFACPAFTVRVERAGSATPAFGIGERLAPLSSAVQKPTDLATGRWWRDGDAIVACVDLPKGTSTLRLGTR
jgi:hypothetical protein